MNIPEMKLIAGSYSFDVRGLKEHGIFLTDFKTGKYHKVCEYSEYKSIDRNCLMEHIREFSSKLHHRLGNS